MVPFPQTPFFKGNGIMASKKTVALLEIARGVVKYFEALVAEEDQREHAQVTAAEQEFEAVIENAMSTEPVPTATETVATETSVEVPATVNSTTSPITSTKREKINLAWWQEQIENPREGDEFAYYLETQEGLMITMDRIEHTQPDDHAKMWALLDLVNEKINNCYNREAQALLDETSRYYDDIMIEISERRYSYAANLLTHYKKLAESILNPSSPEMRQAFERIRKPNFAAVRVKLLTDIANAELRIREMDQSRNGHLAHA